MSKWPSRNELVFAGNYQSFETLSWTINSDKITVLNFYAPRCPSCRTAHSNILDEANQLPENLQILNIDYDSNKNLREKYWVTSQHTFVLIDRNSNKIRSIQWLNHVSEIIKFVWPDLLNPIVPTLTTWDIQTGNTEQIETIVDQNPIEITNTSNDDTKKEDTMKKEIKQSAGIYMDYESGKKYISDSTKKVVLFFHASRCPTCKQAEKNIIDNKNTIDPNLVILKVDYDSYSDLKQKYWVTTQTSYVFINSDGSLNKKSVWFTTLEAIENFIK